MISDNLKNYFAVKYAKHAKRSTAIDTYAIWTFGVCAAKCVGPTC